MRKKILILAFLTLIMALVFVFAGLKDFDEYAKIAFCKSQLLL